MPRNDKTFLALHSYLLNLKYSNEWREDTDNEYVNTIHYKHNY